MSITLEKYRLQFHSVASAPGVELMALHCKPRRDWRPLVPRQATDAPISLEASGEHPGNSISCRDWRPLKATRKYAMRPEYKSALAPPLLIPRPQHIFPSYWHHQIFAALRLHAPG